MDRTHICCLFNVTHILSSFIVLYTIWSFILSRDFSLSSRFPPLNGVGRQLGNPALRYQAISPPRRQHRVGSNKRNCQVCAPSHRETFSVGLYFLCSSLAFDHYIPLDLISQPCTIAFTVFRCSLH